MNTLNRPEQRSDEGKPRVPPDWYANEQVDLFELWDVLWSGKWLVVRTGMLCTLVAVIYALMASPIYESRVVMLPADDGGARGGLSALAGQFGGLASLAGIDLGGGGGQTEAALEILDSFAFQAAFIESENLMPILLSGAWDAKQQQWTEQPPPTMQDAVLVLREAFHVSVNKKSVAIKLTVSWTDPEIAAQWANRLVDLLNSSMREQSVAEARRAVDYLEAQLAVATDVDMRSTLYRLIEAQMKTIMLANVREDFVFRVVDPAFPAEGRSSPKRKLLVVLGGMFGGILGVTLVFLRLGVDSYRRHKGTLN